MRTIETKIYTFDELSEKAQEKALAHQRELEAEHFAIEYDDFINVAGILGIDFDQREYKTVGGATRYCPKIWYRLAYSQGDYASFEGRYVYAKGCSEEIRSYAPVDEKLHRIADALTAAQKAHFYKLEARITTPRDYVSVEVYHADDQYRDVGEAEKEIKEAMRDLADWMYDQVRSEYEYYTSEEYCRERLKDGDDEFYEDGSRA